MLPQSGLLTVCTVAALAVTSSVARAPSSSAATGRDARLPAIVARLNVPQTIQLRSGTAPAAELGLKLKGPRECGAETAGATPSR